jgi:GDP-4-dehydro-6-deoxy-D-mannose reductase
MRVMVTGAEGFVGPHLVEHLTASGDTVLALRGPGSVPADQTVDVLDPVGLRAAIESFGPDALVNLAGVSSVSQSHAMPLETFRVNLLGVVNICDAMRIAAPRARLLLVGSGEMYGAVPSGARAAESDPLEPNSPYAAAKLGAEVAALAFRRSSGLDVVAARPFNHLGRGQRADFSVPSFARQLEDVRAGRSPGVLSVGNLGSVRDFSHVRDVVAAYRLLLERGVSGEAYNVCSGEGRTMRSIVEELISVSGVEARIELDPERVRPIDIPSLVGDPSRLRALGWKPRHAIREALADVLSEARARLD